MGEASDLFHAESDSPKGIAAAALLDAIIIIILGIVDLVAKHTIGSLSSTLSFVVILAIAAGLLLSAYLLIKKRMSGYILAWIMAIITVVFGAALSFGYISSTMVLKYYYLITGVFMVFFLFSKNSRKGLA